MNSFWGLILFAWALAACILIGSVMGREYVQYQATERGYGQYCPKDGDWAWRGECL